MSAGTGTVRKDSSSESVPRRLFLGLFSEAHTKFLQS
jgi:hypothetical protein